MKLKLVIIIFLLMSSCCFASGWLDFELDIGDGYYIFKANAMDVCLGKVGSSLIIHPRIHDGVGPIVSYANTEKFVFTKNIGRKDRNLFAGDTVQNNDSTKEFYFIVSKADDSVIGPLSKTDFVNHPNVLSVGPIDWAAPINPNFWKPLGGTLFFCLLSIPILAIGLWWIWVPPVIVGVVLILIIRKKRKRQSLNKLMSR